MGQSPFLLQQIKSANSQYDFKFNVSLDCLAKVISVKFLNHNAAFSLTVHIFKNKSVLGTID